MSEAPDSEPQPIRITDIREALADCERRINEARAAIFAKDDGVVTKTMTELEREWLTLSARVRDHAST
jgi:hypothetical protein